MADSAPLGGPEASHDDTPRQVNVEDGEKGDRAVESLPKTQGMSANTAIVIPEDRDEDEDDDEEEEDDYQLDASPPLPLEIDPLANHASGILEGGPGVNSAGIPGKSNPIILCPSGCTAKLANSF